MKEIAGLDKLTRIYADWKPSDLALVKSLRWSASNLEVIFLSQERRGALTWPDISGKFIEISITFVNVSNFKLSFPGSTLHQISGFDILDISDSAWEDVNFQIADYENDSISFNCENVIIDSVSQPFSL